ncbi:MAG: hypothetical protein IJN04_07185 [Clostridia bacterium]|nr:hypothetical protein [Clostridia bacterium]
MRKILDTLFHNKNLSIGIPILIAAILYLLFVAFGMAEDKTNFIIITPIVSVVGFFGVFAVVLVQVKNTLCPAWFLNLFECLVVVIVGVDSLAGTVAFIISGFQNFTPMLCLGPVIFSAVSWAHSKRED